jgi:hypothetical protein
MRSAPQSPMQWHQRPVEAGEPVGHQLNEPPMRRRRNHTLATKKNIPVQCRAGMVGWTPHQCPLRGVSPGVLWRESASTDQRGRPARGGSQGVETEERRLSLPPRPHPPPRCLPRTLARKGSPLHNTVGLPPRHILQQGNPLRVDEHASTTL